MTNLSFTAVGKGHPQRRATDKPATQARLRKMYERPTSITNFLPIHDYDDARKQFQFDDDRSVGALLEIEALPTEGRTDDLLEAVRAKVQDALTTSVKEDKRSPWILQVFAQDEADLTDALDDYTRKIAPAVRDTQFTQNFLGHMKAHYMAVSREAGVFVDKEVTNGPWKGSIRKVRACLYRLVPKPTGDDDVAETPEQELENVVNQLITAYRSADIPIKRLEYRDYYNWMMKWFNPRPAVAGGDVRQLIYNIARCPTPAERPYGADLSDSLILGMPHANRDAGVFYFDGLPHRYISVNGLRKVPKAGQLSGELIRGQQASSMMDALPPGSIVAMTVIFISDDKVTAHLDTLQGRSKGNSAEETAVLEEVDSARKQLREGNKMYRVSAGVYLRGEDLHDLRRKSNEVSSQLIANGFQPIAHGDDLIAQDAYLRSLPFAFDAEHDLRDARRARLWYSSHIAAALPIYGRNVGTGNPGWTFFNRGGEPFNLDPLHPLDRKTNAHALVLGPTGSGKSATSVALLMQQIAIRRPRVFIIEAGNSFGLMGQHCERQGLKVRRLSIQPGSVPSLPPFTYAIRALEAEERKSAGLAAAAALSEDDAHLLDPAPIPETDSDDDGQKEPDYLGQMELLTRIMVTGTGEVREKITRLDIAMLRMAILQAARAVRAAGGPMVLTRDVVAALRNLEGIKERWVDRAAELAEFLNLYTQGVSGELFDRPGTPWPDVDVTILDLGLLAREGYEDQMTIAFCGIINFINDIAEAAQLNKDGRQLICFVDEAHIVTTKPMLAPYIVKIVKMWRKLGAWFWAATQNVGDFPDDAKKLLSMMEFWLCLVTPVDEVEQIQRFKRISDEQKILITSAKKERGKYTEGTIITNGGNAMLVRNVPPPICLALAMTEKDEKAERALLMEEHGLATEIDAAYMVAEKIARKRAGMAA